MNEGIADEAAERAVAAASTVFAGRIWDVQADEVDLGGERPVVREYIRHPGAVAVVALDDDGRVLMLRQYRHPVRRELWEVPAGLLDIPGEDPLEAARRELAEEADLTAREWAVLCDYFTSPGGSDEAIRVFLARGVAPVPEAERFVREDEEAELVTRWVEADDAVAAVLDGRVHNVSAVVGLLALAASRASGWARLRPADSPWPDRPRSPHV